MTDPTAILLTFTSFYTEIYTSRTTLDSADLDVYFETIALYWADNARRECMDSPITPEEVRLVIQSLPNKAQMG